VISLIKWKKDYKKEKEKLSNSRIYIFCLAKRFTQLGSIQWTHVFPPYLIGFSVYELCD